MVYRAVETTEDVVEEVVEGPLVSNDIPVEIVEITETEEVIEEPFVSNDGSYESTEIIVIEEVSEKPPVVVAENEKPSEGSSWWWWPF
ncbi:unnamed protein product [Allacma fusca]|uniref:Uncharacterized protein n=1 Tax=Allacma fusca TaxID=39272 RepID=A0A8J2LN75_9HEXA|nr:unnamed protein product [Allacma fusca]